MKMNLILIFSLFSACLSAPPDERLTILRLTPESPYEALWNATCYVETRFDTMAIGDKHLKHKSYGIAQIQQSRLDDYYRRTGIRYTTRDMFDPAKAKQVFLYYCNGDDMERISREWNGGTKGMSKKSTLKYWHKIKSLL